MTLLINAWTMGLLLALVALGVYVSFRIFSFPDITVDGSFTLGASVAALLLSRGQHPVVATAAAILCGMLAGAVTGVLHTQFQINALLSGILVMTGLFSVNLRVMGKSNLPVAPERTLAAHAEAWAGRLGGGSGTVTVLDWQVSPRDVVLLLAVLGVVAAAGFLLYLFFRTDLGTAMRATGDNPQMIRALGVNVGLMTIAGLALANGLVALSGALLAQYQGFAEVQMGIGMVVWGLASVIIGEALVGTGHLGLALTGAVMGSLLFRLMVVLVLRAGLDANDLKLITALFVFAAMVLPRLVERLRPRQEPKHA